MRHSELFTGNLDKNHLGSSGKGGNVLYLILRDYGVAERRLKVEMNIFKNPVSFFLGIRFLFPGRILTFFKNNF